VPSQINDERGVALIIVMLMLLLLSVLGATMLSSSSSELKMAGNARNNEEAFYGAEQALVIGQNFGDIYSSLSTTILTWPAVGGGKVYNADLTPGTQPNNAPGHDPNSNNIPLRKADGTPSGVTADVRVQLVGSGNIPVGSGTQMDSGISPGSGNFKSNVYAVNVKAFGKNNTQVELESQVARVVQQ
jgi:Tfp pilus assembly protein PilX